MKKIKYKRLKSIALIMSIVTIICSIPMSIAAEETLSESKEVQEDPIVAESFEYSDPNLDWQGLPIDSKASLGTETGSATRATAVTGELTPGVYSFENVGNTGFWIDTRNDSYNSGAYIQQYTYASNPAETDVFSRGGLFKISKHPTYGTYIIRSMLNNRYTFTIYTGSNGKKYIQNQSIPLDDSAVDISRTFDIVYNSGSYTIKLHNTSYYVTSCHTTASGASGGTDSYLQFTTAQTNKTKWKMYKYSGSLKVGYVFERPASWTSTGLINDTYYNPRLITWCTQLNYNKPYIIPVYGYSDMLDYNWNIDTARFTMTTKFPGELKLNVGVEFSNSANNTLDIQTLTYRIVPQAGDYYIQNASTEKYIYTSGTSASTSSNPLQYQYNQNFPLMQWEIQHVANSGGYVRIKSKGGNVYLGVNASDKTDIVLSSSLNNYTLWRIDVTSRKTLVFRCKGWESSGYVMYAPNSDNNAAIQQTSYVNNTNLSDEWHIVKKVISVSHFYDNSFLQENNTSLIENIPLANSFANIVYARYLNIGIYMEGPVQSYAAKFANANQENQRIAIADQCPTGLSVPCFNTNDQCTNVCKGGHHKNNETISNQLSGNTRDDDQIHVLWSNRLPYTYCKEINGTHQTSTVVGTVVGKRPVISMQTIIGNDQGKLACMAVGLAHEITHCLNMSDVYDDNIHNQTEDNQLVCIMDSFDRYRVYNFYDNIIYGNDVIVEDITGDNIEDIIGNHPFCNDCRVNMKNLAQSYVNGDWTIDGFVEKGT